MEILVVYYSRDGHTRTAAETIAKALNAEIEEIQEVKSRKGMLGYLSAGKDAMLKTITEIKPFSKDPTQYDLVIIGTPIWGLTMACGVRSWLTQYGKDLKKVAFFATMGGAGDKRAFTQMEELCAKSPIATASFIDKKIERNEHQEKLETFIKVIEQVNPKDEAVNPQDQ
jgi:flavodoxin